MSFVLIASFLPHLDALLNATTLTWLLIGYARIRRGDIDGHRRAMLTAFGCSIAFLAVYLTHHALSGSRPFPKSVATPIRLFYYVMLASHVVLAATVPVLAIVTIVLGLRDRREQHRKWAKWTFPIWLYVSVTGIVVYVMLYWLYSGLQTPSAGL